MCLIEDLISMAKIIVSVVKKLFLGISKIQSKPIPCSFLEDVC